MAAHPDKFVQNETPNHNKNAGTFFINLALKRGRRIDIAVD